MAQDSNTRLEEVRQAIEHRLSSVMSLSEALVSGLREPLGHDERRDIQVLQSTLVRLRYQLAWMCGRMRVA